MQSHSLCPLHAAAQARPTSIGWRAHDGSRTWHTWDVDAQKLCLALEQHQISPGERITVQAPNTYALATLFFASWRRGVVICPINPRLPTQTAAEISDAIGATHHIDDAPEHTSDRLLSLQRLAQEANEMPLQSTRATVSEDALATILFTSGSTGLPKAICHNLAGHKHSARASNANLPFDATHRWLLSLSLCHVGGLAILMRAVLGGGAVVQPATATTMGDAIEAYSVTHISVVATQLTWLLEQRPNPNSSLTAVLSGGGPFPPALLRRAFDAGYPLLTTYGATETGSQVCTTTPGAPFDHLNSAGRPLAEWQVRLDTHNEVLVKGPALMLGHWVDGDIKPAFKEDGWYATGDVGAWTPDGRLVLKGRRDQMFISGGENIHPEEIERVLQTFAGVDFAVVVPLANQTFGYRPVAFIRWGEETRLDTTALREWVAERLANFKLPTHYLDWPEDLAREDGKISREAFKQRAAILIEHLSDTGPPQ